MMTGEQKEQVIGCAHDALTAIGFPADVLVSDVVMVIAAINEHGHNVVLSVNTVTEAPWTRIGLLEADKRVAFRLLDGMLRHYGSDDDPGENFDDE